MNFNTKNVSLGYTLFGGCLLASSGFSLIGAFAVSGSLALFGNALYAAFKESDHYGTSRSHVSYQSSTYSTPNTSFWNIFMPHRPATTYDYGTSTRRRTQQTSSTFIPTNSRNSSTTQQTGSTFIPANSGNSSTTQQTGSTFIPTNSGNSSTTRQTGSTFIPTNSRNSSTTQQTGSTFIPANTSSKTSTQHTGSSFRPANSGSRSTTRHTGSSFRPTTPSSESSTQHTGSTFIPNYTNFTSNRGNPSSGPTGAPRHVSTKFVPLKP